MRATQLSGFWIAFTLLPGLGQAATNQFIPFTYTHNIQSALISTFPTGIYTAQDGTQFSIPASGSNFYDNGSAQFTTGAQLTMNVNLPNATDVYTLMNAYAPLAGEIGTIQFLGTGGTHVSFSLTGGNNIRDFYHGEFANGLTNTVPNVNAANTFTCVDSGTPVPSGGCLGAGATGNVNTGSQGTYVVDEQHFSLGSTFLGQTLTQIIITNTTGSSQVILLGMTATYTPSATSVPALSPWGLAILAVLLAAIAALTTRLRPAVRS